MEEMKGWQRVSEQWMRREEKKFSEFLKRNLTADQALKELGEMNGLYGRHAQKNLNRA